MKGTCKGDESELPGDFEASDAESEYFDNADDFSFDCVDSETALAFPKPPYDFSNIMDWAAHINTTDLLLGGLRLNGVAVELVEESWIIMMDGKPIAVLKNFWREGSGNHNFSPCVWAKCLVPCHVAALTARSEETAIAAARAGKSQPKLRKFCHCSLAWDGTGSKLLHLMCTLAKWALAGTHLTAEGHVELGCATKT